MLLIRSLIFLLFQIVFTTIFAISALLTFPLPRLMRYRYIACYARIMVWTLRVICGIHHEVRGLENIPKASCVVLCKHQSAWETLALQCIFPAQVWVLKRELLWIPFFGWALALLSPIAINRSNGRSAMRQLLAQGKERMGQGFFVVIFPEGTRIPFGKRGKYKIGGALLAENTGVPVVAVAHNAGRLWGRNAFSKHPGLVTMSISKPIETAGMKAGAINAQVEAWIENEIQELPH
jgi:1-acyl-sn-glycerol-3-phosphate acyltransferase